MLGLFNALWELESITRPRTAEAADQLCRWAFCHPEPVVRDLALSQLAHISPRLQRSLLQDWALDGMLQEVAHRDSWAWAVEQQFLYGAWADGVPVPRQRTMDETTSAGYRVLLGGYPDQNRIQDHYLRADSAGKRRLVSALQSRGDGRLLSEHHARVRTGSWDDADTKHFRQNPASANWRLWLACPWEAQRLLACADPLREQEPVRSRIVALAAAAPQRPLELRYPRPVRVERHVFQRPVPWFSFCGEALLVPIGASRVPVLWTPSTAWRTEELW